MSTTSTGLEPLSARSPPCRIKSGAVICKSAKTASSAVRFPWMSEIIAVRTKILALSSPNLTARAIGISGLLAQSRPAFTDPAVDRLLPLLGFCHLEGSDQPFETQLQTAWVSFGEQMRVTYASAEGGSAKLVDGRSRPLLPGQDGPSSGDPIGRTARG